MDISSQNEHQHELNRRDIDKKVIKVPKWDIEGRRLYEDLLQKYPFGIFENDN